MKRIFAMMLAIAMMLGMSALASEEMLGKWMMTEIQADGQAYPISMLGLTEGSIDFAADGTGVFSQARMGAEMSMSFVWQAEGEKYMLDMDGSAMEVMLEAGSLKLSDGSGMDMVFVKEGAADESFAPPAVRTDSSREEFNGEWIPETVYHDGTATYPAGYEKVKPLILKIADDGAGWNNIETMSVMTMTVSGPEDGALTLQGEGDPIPFRLNEDGTAMGEIFLEELNDVAAVYFVRGE